MYSDLKWLSIYCVKTISRSSLFDFKLSHYAKNIQWDFRCYSIEKKRIVVKAFRIIRVFSILFSNLLIYLLEENLKHNNELVGPTSFEFRTEIQIVNKFNNI